MRGVAEQGHAPCAPSRAWIAVVERPLVGLLGGLDDRPHDWMPATKLVEDFRFLAARRPRLHPPVLRRDDAHPVHQAAAIDVVVHKMFSRTPPRMSLLLDI